jgi:hypothetical protein
VCSGTDGTNQRHHRRGCAVPDPPRQRRRLAQVPFLAAPGTCVLPLPNHLLSWPRDSTRLRSRARLSNGTVLNTTRLSRKTRTGHSPSAHAPLDKAPCLVSPLLSFGLLSSWVDPGTRVCDGPLAQTLLAVDPALDQQTLKGGVMTDDE